MTDNARNRDSGIDTMQQRGDSVIHCHDCVLSVGDGVWEFARDSAAAIDRHWARRRIESPAMFNGVIHLMDRLRVVQEGAAAPVLEGQFLRTDFKSYLYWREIGFPAAGVRDAFGSALIRAAEGHVVLGRQRPGNVNNGAAYLPGGFIDPQDVTADGRIDIDGSILRELREETGLEPGEVAVQPGYLVTFDGALLSMARELRSALPADELRGRILAHIANDPRSELVDAVIIRSAGEADDASIHPYARRLLRWLLGGEARGASTMR